MSIGKAIIFGILTIAGIVATIQEILNWNSWIEFYVVLALTIIAGIACWQNIEE